MTTAIPDNSELVINWHLTEACNYKCRYCFAKWQRPEGGPRELIHNRSHTRKLLSELYGFFRPGNPDNPLTHKMRWDSLRLNLVGGEPLLYADKALQTIGFARELGFSVSLITNGSLLSEDLLSAMAPDLSVLGFSFDSTLNAPNREIGRADRNGQCLSVRQLESCMALAKRINPRIELKLNTVVNASNWQEDMTDFIAGLGLTKWKVLRMLPVLTNDLAVSDEAFQSFVRRHQSLGKVMCVEDNADMTESYLMIDPCGRFFQSASNKAGYEYSLPILEAGIGKAFSQTCFQEDKFASRYAPVSDGMLARHPLPSLIHTI
ncbi:hypothetical protein AGMMS50256_07340 [Betaproteobacteria bacterium]|nr:hypothetical protein AGMMS50256_07340 [Betaproteobacteria bacterium]